MRTRSGYSFAGVPIEKMTVKEIKDALAYYADCEDLIAKSPQATIIGAEGISAHKALLFAELEVRKLI
jgi:hypothetical protein